MERNPIISNSTVETALAALAEIAKGGSGAAADRIKAAETLLSHAWIYAQPPDPPAPTEEA